MELHTKWAGSGETVEKFGTEGNVVSRHVLPEEQKQPSKEKEGLSSVSFWLGIASIFLWGFSIVPILAIVFGVTGIVRKEDSWKATVGIGLGLIFLAVRIFTGTNPFLSI